MPREQPGHQGQAGSSIPLHPEWHRLEEGRNFPWMPGLSGWFLGFLIFTEPWFESFILI